ncbi:MAG: hypothetical protein WC861_00490 [Candidatus Micrarchaeia archaeon]|jgi:tetratricopeptide (TPR) repeat protein
MPGPEMVQLDPAQKQAPVSSVAFDARKMTLQAKQEVNLLLEKSKSVISTDKAKLENLQVISSFTVTATPGHEKETYEIYRQAVSRANEQLIMNRESFDIQLEETKPGKLYIVCGRYEEREPVVAQNENRATESTTDIAWLRLTNKERKALAATPEELEKAGSIELTPQQWSVLKDKIYQTAEIAYGGRKFDVLSTEERLDVIRRAISPNAAEGQEVGFAYRKSIDPANHDIQKAAETLSKQSGDCDDLALLYVACAKLLKDEGKLDVASVKLAVAGYYNPEKKKVLGHANVIQISTGGGKEAAATFLVDMTVNTTTKNLGVAPEKADVEGLKDGFVTHLNASSKEKNLVNASLVELRLFEGEEGAQSYYYFKKGEYYVNCGDSEKALPALTKSIDIAEKNGLYCGDALVMRGEIYKEQSRPIVTAASKLMQADDKKSNEDGRELNDFGMELFRKGEKDYMDAINGGGLSAFANSKVARYYWNHGNYAEAEKRATAAVEQAPFEMRYYTQLWDVYTAFGHKDAAVDAFSGLKKRLDGLSQEKDGEMFELREMLGKSIENSGAPAKEAR